MRLHVEEPVMCFSGRNLVSPYNFFLATIVVSKIVVNNSTRKLSIYIEYFEYCIILTYSHYK